MCLKMLLQWPAHQTICLLVEARYHKNFFVFSSSSAPRCDAHLEDLGLSRFCTTTEPDILLLVVY